MIGNSGGLVSFECVELNPVLDPEIERVSWAWN